MKLLFFLFLVTTEQLNHCYSDHHDIIATPKIGSVRGSTKKSRNNQTFYAFQGIPYAEPPTEDLRFQPPVPKVPWDGIFDATKSGKLCYQMDADNFENMSEDCLHLNVYTKNIFLETPVILKSVLVYIHGGGFTIGSSDIHVLGPEYLMDRDIVLVTFNYRLGTFGFLSTGTKECVGNMAFKDQVLVLRWIQENIRSFGGNPNSVTLFGHSAGAISVELHMTSPMSIGLFHRGILMSGAVMPQWQLLPSYLELAIIQASSVGCTDFRPDEILKCLRLVSPLNITIGVSTAFSILSNSPVIKFSPAIEPDFGQERFLIEDPRVKVTSGNFTHVPILTGITNDEFTDVAFQTLENEFLRIKIDENFDQLAPFGLLYHHENLEKRPFITRTLKEAFLDDHITLESFPKFGNVLSDGLIGFGVHRLVHSASKYTSVFYYKNGIVHADDLQYLFQSSNNGILVTDPENIMVERMTRLWTNFAMTGNPNNCTDDFINEVEWTKFNPNLENYLNVGNQLVMKNNLFSERYKIWDGLFPAD